MAGQLLVDQLIDVIHTFTQLLHLLFAVLEVSLESELLLNLTLELVPGVFELLSEDLVQRPSFTRPL